MQPPPKPTPGAAFKTLANASPVLIWLTDEHGVCCFFNSAWLLFTGSSENIPGNDWLKQLSHEDRLKFAFLTNPAPSLETFSCEFNLLNAENQLRKMYAVISPVINGESAFEGYMASCIDITELHQLKAEVDALKETLKKTQDEIEQLLYATSHDLQEPMRTIEAYINLIEKSMARGDTKAVAEFMHFVLEGTSRMRSLIAGLLVYSRINRKGAPFASVNLNEALAAALAPLQKEIDTRQAEIAVPQLPAVNGDTFQLVSLFQNLVGNALKFTRAGVKPKIEISVNQFEDYYKFTIKDNGIGIENKFYNRIFALFQKLHARNEYEGTGIGLAVCRKIVERHGGEIWVESEPGVGSSFCFTLKK